MEVEETGNAHDLSSSPRTDRAALRVEIASHIVYCVLGYPWTESLRGS